MKIEKLLLWGALFSTTLSLVMTERAYCAKGLTEYTEEIESSTAPWFTGPLLAPSGHVVPLGYANIEPYVFATDTHAQYNGHWKSESIPRFWGITSEVPMQIGVASFMDVLIIPQFSWSETEGRSATRLGDLPIGVEFQLLEDTKTGWWPAIKMTLRETFPTGKYQKLNPHKLSTDSTGMGSFITAIALVTSHLYHVHKAHYWNVRLGMNYVVPAKVHVEGFNAYGGGFGTRGYVYPGNVWNTVLGLEYSLTRNWVLATDILNTYTNRTWFKGRRGVTASGDPAGIGMHSSNQISLAPAIEYNFNDLLGIIAGCWFTIAGRNSGNFATGVIAFNWYTSIGKTNTQTPVFPQLD